MTDEICDFCSEPNPTWEFPAENFMANGGLSVGGWAACEKCAELVCNRRWLDLAERSLTCCPDGPFVIEVLGKPDALQIALDGHALFAAYWDGTCIPLVAEDAKAQ